MSVLLYVQAHVSSVNHLFNSCCFTAGIDYREVSAEVRFAPFDQRSCVNVYIIDNHIVGEHGAKSFTLELYSVSPKVLAPVPTTEVIIQENDGMHIGAIFYSLLL